jgi:hypothetical protein
MLLIFLLIVPQENSVELLKKLRMHDLSRLLSGSHCFILLEHQGGTKIQEFKTTSFDRRSEYLKKEIRICLGFGDSNCNFYW